MSATTTASIKGVLDTLINCGDEENRMNMANEISQALTATIDKISKENNHEERRILLESFEISSGVLNQSTRNANGENSAMSLNQDTNRASTIFYPFVV